MSLMKEVIGANQLTILRAGDDYRAWRSLNDRRICMHCTKVFSGAEVRIGMDRFGRPTLHCPGAGCDSTPRDWFLYATAGVPGRNG
jgi:hypothetical protein